MDSKAFFLSNKARERKKEKTSMKVYVFSTRNIRNTKGGKKEWNKANGEFTPPIYLYVDIETFSYTFSLLRNKKSSQEFIYCDSFFFVLEKLI
jgi:hypothetical protein